jgi:hypothetical protein
LEFKIVACAIKKQEHLNKYGLNAIDPYILSLSVLIERFVFECGAREGTVVAESRDRTLNNALELAFLDLKIRGTRYLSATKVTKRIHNFAIRKKSANLAGLQLADVVATPIARHVLGKMTYRNIPKGETSFRSSRGNSGAIGREGTKGWGLWCSQNKTRAGPATQFPPDTFIFNAFPARVNGKANQRWLLGHQPKHSSKDRPSPYFWRVADTIAVRSILGAASLRFSRVRVFSDLSPPKRRRRVRN